MPYYSWCDTGGLSDEVKELAQATLYTLRVGKISELISCSLEVNFT